LVFDDCGMPTPPPNDPRRARLRAWLVLTLALLPALAAVWTLPGFVTQDGPAHVYNAHILAESLRGNSPFAAYYTVRWDPLPNWAGHLALLGLVWALPGRAADQVMISATLVGLAASTFWLRRRVAGDAGSVPAALWSALVAMNVTWLWGFYSFLLGACLFPITLGLWWPGRERLGPGRAMAVGGLLVLGYFCHPVSLGLTALGLLVLAATSPGPGRGGRLAWTAASLAPLVPLAILYRRLTRAGGALEPTWDILGKPWSSETWSAQLGWVNPLTLGIKAMAPFTAARRPGFALLVPFFWLSIALAVVVVETVRRLDPGRRGWVALAALLLLGGLAGPDSLGAGHGEYLPQRVFLLGLIALQSALDLDPSRWPGRVAAAALAIAVALQSAFVWDYAVRSDRLVGELLRARGAVGEGQRVGTLLLDLRGPYRANPLLHADCLLGVGTGNVLWTNYEAAHYYFPVHFRGDVPHPPELEFERVSTLDLPADRDERCHLWKQLLQKHRDRIDRLVLWGSDPALDAITAEEGFEPIFRSGRVRALRRRPGPP
jgi:hypothetical protein